MITHIRVKNFKSWKDSGKVDLAPLTGFFGTNSSGKSSLLQMLLLLKQTTERSDAEEVIFFGNESSRVNLGSFHEVIHGHDSEATLGLEFGYKLKEACHIYIYEWKSDGVEGEFPKLINHFTFNMSIRDGWIGPLGYYCIGPEGNWMVEWKPPGRVYIDGDETGNYTVKNCYGRSDDSGDISLFELASAFEKLFANVHPLGATRVQPKRYYHWEGEDPEGVGQNGEDMITSLLNARVDQRTTLYEGQNVPIEERISWWLREMDLAYSFSIKRTTTSKHRDYDVLIQKGPDGAKVTLADMGYGLSQFLPVLVHCYYAPEGSTLILEQPGVHLHPKVQSQLADLLIEVVTERNLQILVESHSEHLLTRLQLRIAEQKISSDQTALYFCENDNGVSNIKPLDVDELGNITNWPANFFGNVRGDLVKMAREQMKRQKKAEDE